jgi:predicted transcriptional regulator
MSGASQIVSELMHQPLTSVGPGASVDEVLSLAKSKGVHHVPIVQRGKLLGLVCTCDLHGAQNDVKALQLARRQVLTVQPDCPAADAAKLMLEHAVGSLIVSNRDGLWGIVTRHDLMHSGQALAELLAESHCASCQSTHHLRQGPGETYLCVDCAERAATAHWYDEGGG